MKKGLSLIFLLLATIGFASSQGLSDLLNGIDESTIILFAVFIIAFALLFFALNKVFKGNTSVSGIISVAISILIVYGINKSGFNIQDSLSDIGISAEALGIILPIVIIAGTIFLIIKFKKDSLLILGGLFIVGSFFVYAKTLLIILGIIMIAIRIFLQLKFPKRGSQSHAEVVRGNYNAGAGI